MSPGYSQLPLRLYSSDLSFFEGYIERLAAEAREHYREAVLRFQLNLPQYAGKDGRPEDLRPTVEEARLVYAKEHGFDDWAAFTDFAAAVARDPGLEPFCDFIHRVEAGDARAVAVALDADPELAQGIATTHKTPLHSTADLETAELLLERGADPDQDVLLGGSTALVHALMWGWDDIADAIAARSRRPSSLKVAAGLGDVARLEQLIDGVDDPDSAALAGREYYRPNHGWYCWRPSPDRAEVLAEALMYAAINGRTQAAEWLLENGAKVDGKAYESTALLRAAWRGRLTMVEWLVGRGAALDAAGWLGGHARGVTALHLAASANHLDVVKFLVAQGADRSRTDDLYHGTPAGWAEHFGQAQTAEYLQALD